ncbi:MAG: caspase family protein [Hyphomonas sp.]
MKMLRILMMLWAAQLLHASYAQGEEARFALVLANGDYPASIGKLTNVYQDAEVMAQSLEATGFDVTTIIDADKDTLMTAFLKFTSAVSDAKNSDDQVVIFVYASMHGAVTQVAGRDRNFLLPAHESIATPIELVVKGVEVQTIIDSLMATGADGVIFVSDACRNELATSYSKGTKKGFVPIIQRPGLVIAYATNAGATTPDDGLFASVLSRHLILKNRKSSYIMLDAIEEVTRRRDIDSAPYLASGGLPDWFCFNGCPTANAGATDDPLRIQILQEEIDDLRAKRQVFRRLSPFLNDLTLADLQQATGSDEVSKAIYSRRDILQEADIDTAQRLSHFLGQLSVETNHFQVFGEHFSFSASTLRAVFPRSFEDEEEAQGFVGDSEGIANRVYANRLGNGDEESGDGWRYRGRGLILLTGRDNYRTVGDAIGVDLENDPDLAGEFDVALAVAATYWSTRDLNSYADANDVAKITRAIVGGYARLERRTSATAEILGLLGGPEAAAGLMDAADGDADVDNTFPSPRGFGPDEEDPDADAGEPD